MATTPIKVKVLIAYGFLIAALGGLYAPNLTKAVFPFAMCVALTIVFFNTVRIAYALVQYARSHLRFTPRRETKARQVVQATRWNDCIDYENYYIPTYLRRQEEVQ